MRSPIILVAALAMASQSSLSMATDWDARDKQYHAAASTLLSTAVYGETRSYGAAMATCLGAGFVKEIYDHQDYGSFSWEDMAANTVGCGAVLTRKRSQGSKP